MKRMPKATVADKKSLVQKKKDEAEKDDGFVRASSVEQGKT